MLHGGNRTSTTGYGYNQRTPEPLDEPTQKLFKAIDDENLEAFKQALEEGANVNAFDEEGMTPLMSIVNICTVSGDGQATLERMAKLLIQKRNIDINTQSRDYVYEERQKRDRDGHLVYLFCGQEVAEVRPGYYIYCNDGRPLDIVSDPRIHFSSSYDGVKEEVKTSKIQGNTALHIACQVGAKDMVKILLTHPNVKTDIINYKYKSPEDCLERSSRDVIKLEFKKAQEGKELLDALSEERIYQAKRPLNQEFNPNCWKRSRNEEIETPLSLIIQSCLQGITSDNKEVLTKLLKHKELDFSQIKPIQAIERNSWVKQIIEQAITERLTATINKKDLDDVKKLVEDNCFMSHAIVTAALRGVNNPIKRIVCGRASDTVEISQLKRDLKQVREERDKLSSENRLLRSNKNEKSSEASAQSRKQNGYAVASFVLSVALVVGACLTTPNLEICIPLAVTAFASFTIGCYCSYKANTALSDVKSTQVSVQRSGRIR